MDFSTTRQKVLTAALASTLLLLPFIASAHCDAVNSDGGCGPTINQDGTHVAGASALLNPADPRWWYLLAVALSLMAFLSRIVWKYLQVETPKKTITEKLSEKGDKAPVPK